MSNPIDLKIENALLRAKSNCNCDWAKSIKVNDNQPEEVYLLGDLYTKQQLQQMGCFIIDWKKANFQVLDLPGCNYSFVFLNGKKGCKYSLQINVVGIQNAYGGYCQNNNFDIHGNFFAMGGDKNSEIYQVLFPYNVLYVSYPSTNFLGFYFDPCVSPSGNEDKLYYNIAQALGFNGGGGGVY